MVSCTRLVGFRSYYCKFDVSGHSSSSNIIMNSNEGMTIIDDDYLKTLMRRQGDIFYKKCTLCEMYIWYDTQWHIAFVAFNSRETYYNIFSIKCYVIQDSAYFKGSEENVNVFKSLSQVDEYTELYKFVRIAEARKVICVVKKNISTLHPGNPSVSF